MRAPSDSADLPVLEQGVRWFAGSAEPCVREVDGFLVRREPLPLAGFRILTTAASRDFDVRARAAIGAVGEDRIPAAARASIRPCSQAAPRSCRAPGSAGEAQINRPAGSATTCTFTPWRWCFPEESPRSRPETMPTAVRLVTA